MRAYKILCSYLLLVLTPSLLAAPVAESTGAGAKAGAKLDLPVQELQKLKLNETKAHDGHLTGTAGTHAEHINYHSLETVQAGGELVSRVEQQATIDSKSGEKPRVHNHVQLDVPAAGVHRELVEGDKLENTTTSASDDQPTKVFHGAARLIQAGSGTNAPQNLHTAVRRAFNPEADSMLNRFPNAQIKSMAAYVYWTGDEKGITTFIEELLEEGLMTKEEAITFLQEIKYQLDAMRKKAGFDITGPKDSYQYHPMNMNLQSFPSYPFGENPDNRAATIGKNWDMSNAINQNFAMLPMTNDIRSEPVKRSFDPMLQSNIVGTSDYDRDATMISEEEYEEMMEKLKAADSLYTEYTLEEIIYQLAKMMFSQSLTRDPREARASIQRFMAFLELEAERGQLSRSIEKKVLDVMVAALSDTIGDHPELTQAREGLGSNPGNRLMRQFLEQSMAEPSMSRAVLAAYKDELLKGPPLHKLAYPERN